VPKEEPIEKLFSEEVEQAPVEEVLSSTDDTSRQPKMNLYLQTILFNQTMYWKMLTAKQNLNLKKVPKM